MSAICFSTQMRGGMNEDCEHISARAGYISLRCSLQRPSLGIFRQGTYIPISFILLLVQERGIGPLEVFFLLCSENHLSERYDIWGLSKHFI